MHRRRVIAATAAGVAIAVLGCDHPTDPSARLRIAIEVASATGPTIGQDPSGDPTLACAVTLSASAAGSGIATWQGATVRLYLGKDRSSVLDSATLSQGDVQGAWSAASIAAGATQQSQWHFSASIPFSADFEFHYKVDGSDKVQSATVPVSCVESGTSSQPPTLGAVTLAPSSGAMSNDSALTVTYTASSAAGLWSTEVKVTGPCDFTQVVAEHLQTTVSHATKVVFPQSCKLSVPLKVQVTAMDGAGQLTSSDLSPGISLADLTPPTVGAQFCVRSGPCSLDVPSGDYFAGETIQFNMYASDNHKLDDATWEVLPFGASGTLTATGTGVSQLVSVLVQPNWTGSIQLKLQARDSVGLTSAALTTPPDSLRLHPTIARPTRTATIANASGETAIDSRRGQLYMLDHADHRLLVVSMATLQVTSTLDLPGNGDGLDLTPQGDSLVISFYGLSSLGIVDLRQPALAVTMLPYTGLDASVQQSALHIMVLANGHAWLATAGSAASAFTVLDVDLATGTGRVRSEVGANGVVGAVFMQRSGDGNVLALIAQDAVCLRRYVTTTDSFSACIRPPISDWQPAVDATGDRIAVGRDVYDASMQKLPQLGSNLTPGGIAYTAISTDGQFLHQFLSYGIIRINAGDGRILDRTPNPIGENWQPMVSPDGTTLVAIDKENTFTKIALIDLR